MGKTAEQGATVLQVVPPSQDAVLVRVLPGGVIQPVTDLPGQVPTAAVASPRMHPMLLVAALAVVAFSAVGIWAFVTQGTRAGSPAPAAPLPVAAPVACGQCGKVTSVLVETRQGQASVEGTVAGAVVGGLAANQVARGSSRRDVATALGAVGGAFAGREIEKRVKTYNVWHIKVQMDDGQARNFYWKSQPPWQAGDAVKVVDGKLTTAPVVASTQ